MGDTAADIARIMAGVTGAASSILTSVATPGTTPTTGASTIDPATGLPYGAVNPATGLPYGTVVPAPETSYVPIVIGGLVLVGIGGYFLMRKRSTPNRRRLTANYTVARKKRRLTPAQKRERARAHRAWVRAQKKKFGPYWTASAAEVIF
jgi:LPXTG-motif cell wall-anchored protein